MKYNQFSLPKDILSTFGTSNALFLLYHFSDIASNEDVHREFR